jgi:hypothetical protein
MAVIGLPCGMTEKNKAALMAYEIMVVSSVVSLVSFEVGLNRGKR